MDVLAVWVEDYDDGSLIGPVYEVVVHDVTEPHPYAIPLGDTRDEVAAWRIADDIALRHRGTPRRVNTLPSRVATEGRDYEGWVVSLEEPR